MHICTPAWLLLHTLDTLHHLKFIKLNRFKRDNIAYCNHDITKIVST